MEVTAPRAVYTAAPLATPLATPLPAPLPPQETPRRPGPSIKPLSERAWRYIEPIQRKEATYERGKKITVLTWLLNHRVQEQLTYDPFIEDRPQKRRCILGPQSIVDVEETLGIVHRSRPPTFQEAANHFKMPRTTIIDWWQTREKLLEVRRRARAGRWPDLEAALFDLFLQRRSRLQVVTARWFKKAAGRLWIELYPEEAIAKPFAFSLGWFSGFRRRYEITPRRITKKATKLPANYGEVAQKFLGFVRYFNLPVHPTPNPANYPELCSSPTHPDHFTRRYPRRFVVNLDETPAPFEFLDGTTYERKGSKTVAAKSFRSGWDKRQATIVLVIYADGIQRVKPLLIFKGDEGDVTGNQAQERPEYDDRVTVSFNKHAYNNERTFLWWLEQYIIPSFHGQPAFLVMDVASFHYTEQVQALLHKNDVAVALIPAGCTSFLQPFDTAINKPFKAWLQEETERLEDVKRAQMPPGEEPKWTTSERRIMTTQAVGAAATKLEAPHGQELVVKAFLDIGITVRPDGSQDHAIRIKDLPALELNINYHAQITGDQLASRDMPDVFFDQQYIHEAEDAAGHLDKLKVNVLKQLCKERRLPTSGNKATLISRLQADEEARACAAANATTKAASPIAENATAIAADDVDLKAEADEQGGRDTETPGAASKNAEGDMDEDLYFAYASILI